MIAFSCSRCGMKFKVKDEYAGRSSTCPTCKAALQVPTLDQTQAFVAPVGHIEGSASSLDGSGVGADVTLAGAVAAPGEKSIRDLLAGRTSGKDRYVIEKEIARGGMGAVLRAIDCDIRREVAVKFMLDERDPRKKARFVEEAQVTGQLEHPNIVPIHELGVDAQKRLFFSMKMVKGHSLGEVLEQLRGTARRRGGEVSLSRQLTILVNVCNALAYAHSRGVVHRDLKPANIMVGDFGEVYVMDWGLAKILDAPEPAAPAATASDAEASEFARFMGKSKPTATARAGVSGAKVSTSREDDADLTQEGAVVGTPVYMPPEQALGHIADIDRRSDIYSLGAILYEMLTLAPPVEKEGGPMAILMRASQGEILPPEQRAPRRSIPRELSAIAMKALAKEKKDRYQTVDDLRRDIERYQEGRSVSAKEDTKWEMLRKFVKRNKGFSAGVSVALMVLVCSLWFISKAWWNARAANAEMTKAQNARDQQAKATVAPLLRSARLHLRDREFEKTFEDVELATSYDPEHAGARLLKAQLLVVRQEYEPARPLLQQCVKAEPTNALARELLQACNRARLDDVSTRVVLAELFTRHEEHALADGMLRSHGKNVLEAREKLLAIYRQRLEKALGKEAPGRLTVDADGLFSLNLNGWEKLDDLTPVKGMPLASLNLGYCRQVRDLTPLTGMELTWLNLQSCDPVRDLTPLQGMPLTSLYLPGCGQVRDLTPLTGMPLTSLNLGGCGAVRDLTPLKGLPLKSLSLHDSGVTDLTPLAGMHFEDFRFTPKNIARGLEILRQMKSLKTIGISYEPEKAWPAAEFWQRHANGEFNK